MTTTLESHTLSMRIERPWQTVYQFLAAPENFPRWASGLGQSFKRVKGEWTAQGPEGPISIRFTRMNEFGIVDHYVTVAPGVEIYIPMRVIVNGRGSEVQFTLFHLAAMSDDKFAEDIAWVERDLLALKTLLESY